MISPTSENIASALGFVSASVERAEWVKVLMAVHSEYPDDTGAALCEAWSRNGDGFDSQAFRDTWRSLRPGRGVTIGTLWQLAKRGGWTPPTTGPAMLRADADGQAKARKAARVKGAEDAEHDAAQRADKAAAEAQRRWDGAASEGRSSYLERKGVRAHGVRFEGETMLVPMRDAAGQLRGLQTIAPDGGKRYLAGVAKRGLFHLIGGPRD